MPLRGQGRLFPRLQAVRPLPRLLQVLQMKTEAEIRQEIRRLVGCMSKEPSVENACKNGAISELCWVIGDWQAPHAKGNRA